MSRNLCKVNLHKVGDPEEQIYEAALSARHLVVLKGLVANPAWLLAEEVKVAAKEAGELISSNDIYSILGQMVTKGLVEKGEQWVKPRPGVARISLCFAPSRTVGDVPRKYVVFKATVDRII